ncbi:MAG: hypothetical protein HY651_10515 [Acidobacteria bacterium]|nr:hypothetical protein [Acidobacteriota bacterium]
MATTAGVTYTYDGDGRRVSKSNGKLYWYGVNGQVLAESDASGTIISEYIYFNGMRIARRDVSSGNVYYFLGDRLGNARVVTNSTGGVVEESDFYPFGGERPIVDSLDNNYKFTGYERDSESTLDHTKERQYSCNQGRWLSPDRVRGSARNPQSLNRYARTWNNPTNLVDPDGAEACPPGTTGSYDPRQEAWICTRVTHDASYQLPVDDDNGEMGEPDPYLQRWDSLSAHCQEGLKAAMPGPESPVNIHAWIYALNRAENAAGMLQVAAERNGLQDWRMLAAIGIRESQFANVSEVGGGQGRGVFQIDLGQNPGVTEEQAEDIYWAADWAANRLASNARSLANSFSDLNAQTLIHATASSYNHGLGQVRTNIRNGVSLDLNSQGEDNGYGRNIMDIMQCFK